MTLYRYSGPPSGVTIGGTEVLLHPGAVVNLPSEGDYTRTLLALGHLTPEPVPPASGEPEVRRRPKSEGTA